VEVEMARITANLIGVTNELQLHWNSIIYPVASDDFDDLA